MLSFAIDVRGHRYRGAWKLAGDGQIQVRSDYGTREVSLNGEDASEVARRVLAELVAARQREWNALTR